MAKIRFYILNGAYTPADMDGVLPPLLERLLKQKRQIVISCATKDRCQRLDDFLWSYQKESFLPHGQVGAEHQDMQPVLICTPEELPSKNEDVFFSLSGAGLSAEALGRFKDIGIFYLGTDTDKAQARKLWRELKESGHTLDHHEIHAKH